MRIMISHSSGVPPRSSTFLSGASFGAIYWFEDSTGGAVGGGATRAGEYVFYRQCNAVRAEFLLGSKI